MTTIHQYLEKVEFDTSNPEPRCPCVLLLDVSDSMSGQPINELNEGLVTFQHLLQQDTLASLRVEIAIITFGQEVRVVQKFVTAHQFEAPRLFTSGRTPMGEAIHSALDMIRQCKDIYQQNGVPYYRPWIFLITDGLPTDEWQSAAQRVKQEESHQSVAFFAVGVQGADKETLQKISQRAPLMLKGLNFREMFVWLSGSLSSVSHSQTGEKVPLPSPSGWGEV